MNTQIIEAERASESANKRLADVERELVLSAADPVRFDRLALDVESAKREVVRVSFVLESLRKTAEQSAVEAEHAALKSDIQQMEEHRNLAADIARDAATIVGRLNDVAASFERATERGAQLSASIREHSKNLGIAGGQMGRSVELQFWLHFINELREVRSCASVRTIERIARARPTVTTGETLAQMRNVSEHQIYTPTHSEDVFADEEQIAAIMNGTYGARCAELYGRSAVRAQAIRQRDAARVAAEYKKDVDDVLRKNPELSVSEAKRVAISVAAREGRYGQLDVTRNVQ